MQERTDAVQHPNQDDMARADEEFSEEQKDEYIEYIEYEMQERTDAVQHPNQDDMARADEEFKEEQKNEYVEYKMQKKTDDVQHPNQKSMADETMQEDASGLGPETPNQEMHEPMAETDTDAAVELINPSIDTKTPQLNSYAHVKARYNKAWFRVCNPPQYVIQRPTGKFIFFKNETQFINACKTVYFYEATGEPETPYKKKKFVHAWLHDEDIHQCEEVVVDPTIPQGVGIDLNIWAGFAAAKLPPVPDADVLDLVKPILHHNLYVHANKNQAHADYFIKWFANPIQRPNLPTGVVMMLYGREGCGKGIISVFHRLKVLGKECSYHTQDLDKELFSTHAEGLVNKVFVHADEVNIQSRERKDSIKHIVTNETITFEPKFAARMTVNNMVNLLLTTNHEDATTISPTCRRYALFKCSNVYTGNLNYFKDLKKHLDRPEVARAWLQYLQTQDLSEYPTTADFQKKRPQTEYLKETQKMSIPCVSRLLSALFNSQNLDHSKDPSYSPLVIEDGHTNISAAKFYHIYKTFHNQGNYKCLQSQTSFGREIKQVNGVEKQRKTTGNHYELNFVKIKKYLDSNNVYDEDAMIEI